MYVTGPLCPGHAFHCLLTGWWLDSAWVGAPRDSPAHIRQPIDGATGDTKAGVLVGTDRYGNKYYENNDEELPCGSLPRRWGG